MVCMLPFKKSMIQLAFLLGVSALALAAQPPAAPASAPDTVVAVINGKEYTRRELERIVKAIGGAIPENFQSNKKLFLDNWALMEKLTEIAEKEGLDKKEPYATRLTYNRAVFLATAMMSEKERTMKIPREDMLAYYEKNKDQYSIAKTKVLYVSFAASPLPGAKTSRTEAEAKSLAGEIAAKTKGGASFVDLVKQYSDDPESKQKDGDYPEIKQSDTAVPYSIKSAIFALKPGEITAPLRQPNGYYIFQLAELIVTPFDKLNDDIYRSLKQERFDAWMKEVREGIKIEFKDEGYLSGPAQK